VHLWHVACCRIRAHLPLQHSSNLAAIMASAEPAPQSLPRSPTTNSRPRKRWGKRSRNHQQAPALQSGSESIMTPTPEQSRLQDAPSVNNTNRENVLALRPASIAPRSQPPSTEPSSAEASAAETGKLKVTRSHGNMGRRQGETRGSGRSGQIHGGIAQGPRGRRNSNGERSSHAGHIHGQPRTNGHAALNSGRQFGGRLTMTEEANAQSLVSSLQADAPEFHPGQQHHQRHTTSRNSRGGKNVAVAQLHTQAKAPRARRGSVLKSTAPDIATRTHEDITSGAYECPICTSEVGRNSKIWSCKTCWTVFHLTCIKKWSANEGSTLAQQRNQDGEFASPRQWRCPGCNLPKDLLPSTYTCWCEKELDPRSISGLPPHSCGQTCGQKRILPKKCPHPCDLLCHAGPCPPCTHTGPIQSCFCGKKSTSRRCIDTNYDVGWSCGEICRDLMPCGEHTCPKPCHEGLCEACEVKIGCRCYCGQVEVPLICYDRGDEKPSKRALHDDKGSRIIDDWIGMFECLNVCQRPFDCGKHSCEKRCHPQELEPPHCPRSPDVVSRCPCGKTPLAEVFDQTRRSCEDPIPNCKKECLKLLPCGHTCQQICHSDICKPCLIKVTIACRCGRTQSSTICHQGNEEQPQCTRACKATLNCGRHECGERCCPGERKAVERQATKRKLRPLGNARIIDDGFEAEHICTRLCGRMLKCGNHNCPELCHKGPCGSCREAIFEDVSCHCGRTVLQPPLPCGTTPPPCRFDCERPKGCGHPRVSHNCHGDGESCPKCPFLIEKPCICGKRNLKNQPCWLADVRCGEICGRKLKCGSHYCRKSCHRPGECEDAGKSCQQSCGKSKKFCGHPCEEPCHAPSSCREDKPCQNKMLVTCDCQNLKQELKCNASKSSEGNSKKSLSCDNDCARLERNRKLALALNIDPEAHKDDHIPYSTTTLQLFRENQKWAQIQEREFRVFAADEHEKRLRFKPMPPHHRAFLHSLSEDLGFDSESMDPEPHRHVAVFKTPRFVMAPMKTLAESVRIRSSVEASTTAAVEAQRKLRTSNESYSGFLLSHPRFGLTLEEVRFDFSSVLDSSLDLAFDISFLPSEEIILKARPSSSSTTVSTTSIEASLKALKPSLSVITSSKNLAKSIQLCASDASLNILRRELDDSASNGGWSQVAAKAAAPRMAPRQMALGEKSVYTVLGSRLKDAKKKKEDMMKARKDEDVVEDWEEEVRKEEAEQTKVACGDSKPNAQAVELPTSDLEEPDQSPGGEVNEFVAHEVVGCNEEEHDGSEFQET